MHNPQPRPHWRRKGGPDARRLRDSDPGAQALTTGGGIGRPRSCGGVYQAPTGGDGELVCVGGRTQSIWLRSPWLRAGARLVHDADRDHRLAAPVSDAIQAGRSRAVVSARVRPSGHALVGRAGPAAPAGTAVCRRRGGGFDGDADLGCLTLRLLGDTAIGGGAQAPRHDVRIWVTAARGRRGARLPARHDTLPADGPVPAGHAAAVRQGFVAYERLREIGAASLHYLCPMRLNGNPRIVAIHRAPVHARRALKAHPDGIWLRDVLPPTKRIRTTWDLEVTVRPITRAAADTTPVRTRLIIVAGPQGTQRPYLTDLAATHWTPDALRELYRLRWQVELLFKELTQDLNLGVLPTKDPHAVQIFVWASLIALAVSRTVSACFHPLRLWVGLAAHLRPRLVTRALRATIRLLAAALTGPRHLARLLLPHFVSELLRDIYSPDTERPDSFSRL